MGDSSLRELVVAIATSDWSYRVWTLSEYLLSTKLVFLTKTGLHDLDNMFHKLTHESATNGDWKAWGAIARLAAFMTTEQIGNMGRLQLVSPGRLTTKSADLARALFPLFNLLWPGSGTSLEEGQIILLDEINKQINDLAAAVDLHGPIGLPKPWGWAPSVFPGNSGTANGPSREGREITTDGLFGRWAWEEV